MSTAVSPLGKPFLQRAVVHAPAAKNAILAIGRDAQLLASRAAVLRTSGYLVYSASPEQVHLLDSNIRVTLVVLGHTLDDLEVETLAGYFRRTKPAAKLMLTCFDPRPDAICALVDDCVSSTDGPVVLLRVARRLLDEHGPMQPFQA